MTVSILVLLDTALPAQRRQDGIAGRHRVSILVLLDTALPAAAVPTLRMAAIGFDPCSPGYRSAGWDGTEDGELSSRFRSLFSWIPLCRVVVCLRRDEVLLGFRSLFSWIPLCRSPWPITTPSRPSCFDPCSPGYRSAGPPRTALGPAHQGVSILVLLDTALPGDSGRRDKDRSADVSILVLLDTALPVVGNPGANTPTGLFRSLFSWIPLCRLHAAASRRHRLDVSILVLLDTALPVRPWLSRLLRPRGFDPCSPGYRSAGGLSCCRSCPDQVFRSLFSWIPLCRTCGCPAGTSCRWRFDPCSPGYRSAGCGRTETREPPWTVSILVLLDTALPGRLAAAPAVQDAMFRSLFSWIPLCRRRFPERGRRAGRVSILVLLDTALPASSTSRSTGAPSRFRSLFSWIPLCRFTLEGWTWGVFWFRSLFSWIPLCRSSRWRAGLGGCSGFDPCSPGYRSAGSLRRQTHSKAAKVSILVLLDTALPALAA